MSRVALLLVPILSLGACGLFGRGDEPKPEEPSRPTAAVAPPVAQTPPETEKGAPNLQQYGDWGLHCEKPAGDQPSACVLFQNLILREENKRIVQIAVGRIGEPRRPVAALTLPLGIGLVSGVALEVGEGMSSAHLLVERCDTGGCRAHLVLNDDLLASFRETRRGSITFDDGAGRKITVPFSLRGFAEGFAQLGP